MPVIRNVSVLSFAGIVLVAVAVGFLLGRWSDKENSTSTRTTRDVAAIEPTSKTENENRTAAAESESESESDEVVARNLIPQHGTAAQIDFENLPTDQAGMDALFTTIFRETSPSVFKRLFAELLDHLEPEQAPLLLHSFRLRGGLGVEGHEEYRWFWDRWADIDGRNAADLAFKIDGNDGWKSTQITNMAIKAWARHEPAAAIAWLAEQQDIPLKSGMRSGLLEGIMEFHPDEAMEILEEFEPTREERNRALGMEATRIAREFGPDELDAWFAALPEITPGREAITKEVTQIHLAHGVEHAIEWAHDDPELLPTVLGHFSKHSPEKLFEYAAAQDNPIGSHLETALNTAAQRWGQDNPDLMGTWLHDNMDSPHYDAIAGMFINTIKSIDGDAARAWTETIQDPQARADAMKAINTN